MKIALLTDAIYPYEIGGMQKHSFYLAKYLAKNRVFVDLYHMYTNINKKEVESLDVFDKKEKEFIRSFTFEFPKIDRLPGHYIRESLSYSESIYEILKMNLDVDFIYVQGFAGWKLLKEKKKGFKCPPVGINFHGLNAFQMAPSLMAAIEYYLLYKKPIITNIRNADFVFSLGGKLTDILKNIGVPSKNILSIPIGIGQDWINEPTTALEGPRKFIFIGRYNKIKGIEDINSVINSLLHKNRFEFHFIGFMPEEKKIFSESIHYWGLLSDQDTIKKIVQSCDVLVCSSYSEGMPTVILEAMASGLSVIATDVGAVNCVVDNENGWLVRAGDRADLKQAMEKAIKINEALLIKKKLICQQKIKKQFLWETVIEQTIDKIREII